MASKLLAPLIAVGICAGIFVATACGSANTSSFDEPDATGPSDDDAMPSSSGFLGKPDGPPQPACEGLECKIVDCGGGPKTTISGTVFAPNKLDPLYNVILYVPNGDLQPFPSGVTCDKCGAITSGSPIVTALSGSDGKFTLDNVPAGDNIPIVMQVGRWRRKVVIPHVTQCADNALDAEQTRLPRNKTEGDIPLIALATSPYDPEECILRKIGIDDSEFTVPTDTGRVHIYKGAGATLAGASPPASSTLWATLANLTRYDLAMFPCQTSGYPDATGHANIQQYADTGGRVFVTDLDLNVIQSAPAPWPATATWGAAGSFTNPGLIDTTFPKGQALADWLQANGDTTTKGQITLQATYHRFGAAVAPAQRWLYSSTDTQTYSFNTPVAAAPADQCGRVVYSSFHIANDSGTSFPTECTAAKLTPQEKVLEFLLFDLAACIQKDDAPPVAPPVK
jgi:hypothetical protein